VAVREVKMRQAMRVLRYAVGKVLGLVPKTVGGRADWLVN
jgi:hypothetical protein